MAVFNGNSIYLAIDSVDLSAEWLEIEVTPDADDVDATVGSGATHKDRVMGLSDYSYSLQVVYEDTTISDRFARIKPGYHTLEFAPEGTGTGKPKHLANVFIKSAPFKQGADKPVVSFNLSMLGRGTPTTDIMEGGVY